MAQQAPAASQDATGNRRAGRGRGASLAYSLNEINFLFDIIERILPINGEEWEEVEAEHRARYPQRSLENLKRKFQETYRKACKAKPTGDPRCPAHVLRPMEIKNMITMKCNLDDGEDSELDDVVGEDRVTNGDMVRNISPQEVGENIGEELQDFLPPFPDDIVVGNDLPQPLNAVAPAVPSVRGNQQRATVIPPGANGDARNVTILPARANSAGQAAAAPARANAAGQAATAPARANAAGQAVAAAAPATSEDAALKIALPSLGKRKKNDPVDPFIQLYQMKMLDAMEERKEDRKRLSLEAKEREREKEEREKRREEERKEEAKLRREEMEMRRLEAQSFQAMMMACMLGKKPNAEN